MKKTKFIVAFLLVCVLSIGGAVVVFADNLYDGSTMTISSEDGVSYVVPFVDVTTHNYLLLDFGNPVAVLVDAEMIGNTTHRSFTHQTLYSSADGGKTWNIVSRSGRVEYSYTYYNLQRYISSCDVSFENKVVFRKTEVPIARAAVVLPEKVGAEVKTILTIAIGGLALLIGSMVLLPKLKLFLRG